MRQSEVCLEEKMYWLKPLDFLNGWTK